MKISVIRVTSEHGKVVERALTGRQVRHFIDGVLEGVFGDDDTILDDWTFNTPIVIEFDEMEESDYTNLEEWDGP